MPNERPVGRRKNMFFVRTKNSLKLLILFFLGVLLVISLAVLFLAARNQKRLPAENIGSSDPQAVQSAQQVIESLLVQDTLNFVKEYSDKETFLEVKVDGRSWRKLPVRERKQFVKDISSARATLGFIPDVTVNDAKTGMELAVSERGRVALAGHDD